MSLNETIVNNTFYRETKDGMKRDKFPHRFFEPSLRKKRIKTMLEIICLELEGKKIEEVYDGISWEIATRYGLDKLTKFIPDYTQKSRKEIIRSLFRMVFPELAEKSLKEVTIEIYEELLNDERKQFPNHFFSNVMGTERSIIIYRHVFENLLQLDPGTSSYIPIGMYSKFKLDKINPDPRDFHKIAYFL